MNEQVKMGDIVFVINVDGLYESKKEYIGKVGKILQLDPYVEEPIQIEFPNGNSASFKLKNIRFANNNESKLFYNQSSKDIWKVETK